MYVNASVVVPVTTPAQLSFADGAVAVTEHDPLNVGNTETTGARTLALSDAYKYLRCTSTTAVAITVPLQSSVAWEAHTEILFEQANTGQITISGASGVTVNSRTTAKSSGQYAVIGIKRVAENIWTVVGDRATS